MVVIFIWLHFVRECRAAAHTGQDLVTAMWMEYCSAPDASFLLSRKMMGWDEHIPLPHSHTIKILIFLHWDFPPLFLWRRVIEDASVSLSSGSPAWWLADVCTIHSSAEPLSPRWYRSGAACKWGGTEKRTQLPARIRCFLCRGQGRRLLDSSSHGPLLL